MVCAKVLNSYKSHLKGLQEFRLNDSFDLDRQWTDEDLYAITPRDVSRYLKKRAYGTPDPGPGDRPIAPYLPAMRAWPTRRRQSHFSCLTH